jgi:hypothetical protein
MRYERVKIIRDERTVYNRAALPWEVPIFEFMFGEGSVHHTGAFDENAAPYPDPKEEFLRLSGTFGADPENGIPHVASVYGQAGAGVRALAKVIEEAEEDAIERRTPKQSRTQLVKEFSADPIMG